MPEQNNTFTLEQAKHFHMEHATDLRLPGTGGGSVKSSIDYNEILVPQWDKATYHEVQFPSKLARTYGFRLTQVLLWVVYCLKKMPQNMMW